MQWGIGRGGGWRFLFFGVALFFSLTYLVFAIPSVSFVPPTFNDSTTTGFNWVFVNVTSSEPLNQSLLEWGNSSGYFNLSMLNSSLTNWFLNRSSLPDGAYNYTVWAQNTTGNWNRTARRFVTVQQGPSGCSVINAATYNTTTNTIVLNNQTSTLCTIYYDVANTAVLAYNASENSYLLNANITISSTATLVINSSTLKFNETLNNTYGILNEGELNITNAVITSSTGNAWHIKNPNVAWYLNDNPSLWLRNVDFSRCGAVPDPCIQLGEYNDEALPNMVLDWTNITIHDTLGYYALFLSYAPYWVNISDSRFYNLTWRMIDLTRGVIRNSTFYNLDTGSGGTVLISWGMGGSVYDSKFYNVNIGKPTDGAIFYCKEGSGGCIFENNLVYNFNTNSVLGVYGSQITNPVIFWNNVIENGTVSGDGVIYWRANQYLGGVNTTSRVYNNRIKNVTGPGFVYHSGGQNARIWNNTLLNVSGLNFVANYQYSLAGGGIYNPGDAEGSILYDMEFNDVRIYDLNDPANQSKNGRVLPFANVKYNTLTVDLSDDSFYDYKYLDLLVRTSDGTPVNVASVQVLNEANGSYPPINLYAQNRTSSFAGADGHTPLPSDMTNTFIILDFWKTSASQQNMSYSISAYDPSSIWTNVTHTIYPNGTIQQLQPLAQATGVNPDASWYRSNPNTYQNTTILQINYTKTNITVNAGLNATNITVTKWNVSLPQGQVLINFTAESVNGNNVNFTVCSLTASASYAVKNDGSAFTTKTANSQGCIWFNNSAWTSHVFTLEAQSGTSLTACGNLDVANTTYLLVQNVNSSGTCFNILANNVTLDGQGFTVNYSQSVEGYGVNNSGGYGNITIKNMKLIQGNSSNQYGYGIYLSSSSTNTLSNNTITTSGRFGYGIYLLSSDTNTFSNNNITTLTDRYGYGIWLASSNSTILSNNTITTSGRFGYGIYLLSSSTNTLSANIMSTSTAESLLVEGSSTTSHYNHTIDETNLAHNKPIKYYFNQNNIVIENNNTWGQLYVAASNNVTIRNITILNADNIILGTTSNTTVENSNISYATAYGSIKLFSYSNANVILNNTITTSNTDGHGVFLLSSNTNTVSSNNIHTSGLEGFGIYVQSSDTNTFSNNSIFVSGGGAYGIWFYSSSTNTITGGSISSQSSSDYYFQGAGTTNNFTNTNFTAQRDIYFSDATSWFNYNNETSGDIWLKTRVSAASTLIRTLGTWSQSQMKWNDTNSTAGITAGYNLTGLLPNSQYRIYATSSGVRTNPYNLTTDAAGVLNFTLALGGNTEVNVWALRPPAYSLNSTSSTGAGASIVHSLYWASEEGLAGYVFSFDNCTGTFVNDTWVPMAGLGNWSAVTKTANSTVGCTVKWKVYANDTSNRWNESQIYSYVTTNNPPYYSNTGVNMTITGQPAEFSAYWQDDTGLSGFIFSTNNSGIWQNETWQPITGMANWSRVPKTLNSTVGLQVGYRFYANDTANQWNDTGILTLTTISAPVGCSAIGAATYNASSNTIMLNNQTSTLCTIYYDVGNESLLGYNITSNGYTLSANIVGGPGALNEGGSPADADLVLENTTLVIASNYTVQIRSDLRIKNMTVRSLNSSYIWKIHGGYTSDIYPFRAEIRDSDFSGGVVAIRPWGSGAYPTTPVVVRNNRFHDVLSPGAYILDVRMGAAQNASVYNNTFENCNISTGAYNGVISFSDNDGGLVVDKLFIRNCSTNSYGMVYFYGVPPDPSPIIANFEMYDNSQGFYGGKEWANVFIVNGSIRNRGAGTGIKTYRAYNAIYWDKAKYWIWNVNISDVSTGIANNGYDDYHLLDIYNVRISNASTVYSLLAGTGYETIFFVTNTLVSNYTTKYTMVTEGSTEVREFELADIYVKDAANNPLSGMNVTVTVNVSDGIAHSVSRHMPGGVSINQSGYGQGLQELSSTHTLANGHTPLPNENREYTLALLRRRQTTTVNSTHYSYNFSVFDPSGIWTNVTHTVYPNGTIQQLQPLAQVTGVTPDESWYRSNPNTYQNTTVLQINYTRTNITVNANQNATNITVSKWNTSLFQGQILVNFTAESVNGNNVNFTVCNLTATKTYAIKKGGSSFASETADSSGCVWFNNSAWTSHVFTVEEQGQGPSGCSAINAAFYNASSNTIVLNNQTSTLCTIYYDVNNQSVLSYNLSSNTYALNAHILGKLVVPLDSVSTPTPLLLNDTNIFINHKNITTWSDFSIVNVRVSGIDWNIYSYGYHLTNGIKINNSDFTGGRVTFQPPGGIDYNVPSIPIRVENSRFHDTTLSPSDASAWDRFQQGVLAFDRSSEFNAYVSNITFENITIAAGSYNGVLVFSDGGDNTTISNIHIHNSSVNSYGMVHFYGTNDGGLSTFFSNFEFLNNNQGFVGGKEWGNMRIANGVLDNSLKNGSAFIFYRGYDGGGNRWHKTKYWIWNMSISGFVYVFQENSLEGYHFVDIYDVIVNNATILYSLSGDDTKVKTYFVTNIKATNITTTYSFPDSTGKDSVREFELADILVQDSNGNNISNATITITSNGTDNISYSVSRYMPDGITLGQPGYGLGLTSLTTTTTGANGHTPLPDENSNYTVALLRHMQTKTNTTYYSYTLSAFDPNHIWTNVTHAIYPNGTIQQLQPLAQATNVTPDESWYRLNPNTYQNTTVLQINYTRTNITVNANQNATNITVTKWNTSLPQGQILVNFTAESVDGNNVNFSVCSLSASTTYAVKKDGSAFAAKVSDSQGCIWFNNSAWTSHIFTVEEQSGISLTACGNLDVANATYLLVQNVNSSGTCFNVLANNVALDGQGFTVNYSRGGAGYAINNSGGYDNIALKNLNLVTDSANVAIAASGMMNSNLSNSILRVHGVGDATAISLSSGSNQNRISGNNITGLLSFSDSNSEQILNNYITSSGAWYPVGIDLGTSSSHVITGNTITISGTVYPEGIYARFNGGGGFVISNNTLIISGGTIARGIDFSLAGGGHTLSNNLIYVYGGSDNYGLDLSFSINSAISGGSVTASKEYVLSGIGTNTSFTNTNFTGSRKISFGDATSWFNYNNETNGNVWLKTKVSAADTLTRTLVTWSQSQMKWNDTNSSAGTTATYNITGLLPSVKYRVYNTSGGLQTNPYALTTDVVGALNFSIFLNGNTQIDVRQTLPPVYSLNSTSSVGAGTPVTHSLYWSADDGVSTYVFSFDNCAGSFVNETHVFSGTGNWSSITKTTNSTAGCLVRWKVYANDTSNRWNESQTFSYVTTNNPPYYSNMGVDTAISGQSAQFSAYWQEDTGLSGFIFSTNNSGTWQNESWQPFTGIGNWSRFTMLLNSTIGLSIGYRFYVNDTANQWNDTGVLTVNTVKCYAIGAATYNTTTNTIMLNNQTSNLCTIWYDINNNSVLSYDSGTNAYTLNAKIQTANDATARPSLTVSDTTLLVNNTANDEYYINGGWILNITNSTIKSNNGARFRIWAPSVTASGYHATIDRSTIIGGWVYFRINSASPPAPPYIRVLNTTIRDVNMAGAQIPNETTYGSTNDDTGPLVLFGTAGYNARLENITISNVSGGGVYSGTIFFSSEATNLFLKNIQILNSSHPTWGVIRWYGAPTNLTMENIYIEGVTAGDGTGISNKEGLFNINKTHFYKNITIRNFIGNGFQTYQNMFTSTYPSGAKLENLIIDGAPSGGTFIFEHDYAQTVNLWVFNARLANAATGFRTRNNNYYFTNTLVQNITTKMYDTVFGSESGNVNWYELLDVQVVDINENPIGNATINISPNTTAPVPNVVDKWFNNKTSTYTGSDGHTLLPFNENETVAILRQRDYNSGYNTSYYSYAISAFDPNNIWTNVTHTIYPNGTILQLQPLAQVTNVSPDASWYRPDPNVPTYTVNLTISYARTNLTFAVTDATNITVFEYSGSKINFTAVNSTAGQRMNITVSNGTFPVLNGYPYVLKKGGLLQSTQIASANRVVFVSVGVGSEYLVELLNNLSVSLNSPPDNLLTNNPVMAFNCSAFSNNSLRNISLFGNFSGVFVLNGSVVVSGSVNSTSFVRVLQDGSYLWNCLAYDSTGAVFAPNNFTFTVDTVPPGSITNLANQSQSFDWIFWNWTNPSSDFGHVEVYLNGSWKANTSNSFYNATGLNASTWYRLSVRAVDAAGNVNLSWVNSSVRTLADPTPPSITIVRPENVTYNYLHSLPLNFSLSEPASWCGYSLDGAANVTIQSCLNTTFNVSAGGLHALILFANDSGGNMNFSLVYFSVDVLAPALSNVSSGSITSSSAVVSWVTDELGDSTVYFGTTANTVLSAGNSTFAALHSIPLSGLAASTLYYFNVSSCDLVGNCNVSVQYSFSTFAGSTAQPGGSSSSGGSQPALVSSGTKSVVLNVPSVKVVVLLRSELSNPSLVVAVPVSVPVPVSSGIVYQYLNFTKIGFNNSDVLNATVEFRVNRSWVDGNSVGSVHLARYSNGWAVLRTELVNSTGSHNTYRAYTSGFSYFAVVGEMRPVAVLPSQGGEAMVSEGSIVSNHKAHVLVSQEDIDRALRFVESIAPQTVKAHELLESARLKIGEAQRAFDGGEQELAGDLLNEAKTLAGEASGLKAVSVSDEKRKIFTILLALAAVVVGGCSYYSKPRNS